MAGYLERQDTLRNVSRLFGSDGNVARRMSRHCSAASSDDAMDTSTPEARQRVLDDLLVLCEVTGQALSGQDMQRFCDWVDGIHDADQLANLMIIDHMDPAFRNA